MNELIVVAPLCSQCGREIPPGLNDCPDCETSHVSTAVRPMPAFNLSSTLERRWVLITILLVAGPLGLLLIWPSRCFARSTKIVVTVGVVLVTMVLPAALIWYWCEMAVRPLVDALAR